MTPEHPGFPAARMCSRIAFALALVASAIVGLRIQFGTCSFEAIFADLGAELPGLTQVFLDVPMAWVCLALAAVSTAKEFLVRNPMATLPLNGLHLGLLIVLHEIWVEAMFQPLFTLLDRLG